MKKGRRTAPVTVCEACEQPAKRRDLTKHKGKWRCDECLNGDILPIEVTVLQSNMCAWEDEAFLGYGDELDEVGGLKL